MASPVFPSWVVLTQIGFVARPLSRLCLHVSRVAKPGSDLPKWRRPGRSLAWRPSSCTAGYPMCARAGRRVAQQRDAAHVGLPERRIPTQRTASWGSGRPS